MSKFEMSSENFNAVVVDLLVDILAYNKSILEKINSNNFKNILFIISPSKL